MGVAVLDRFTWALLEFTKAVNSTSSVTIQDLFSSLDPKFLSSTPDIKQSDWTSLPTESKVVDFMGNVRTVVVAVEPVFLNNNKSEFAFAPNRFTLDQDSLFPLERGLLDAPSREYFFIQKGSSLMGILIPLFLFVFILYSIKKTAFER